MIIYTQAYIYYQNNIRAYCPDEFHAYYTLLQEFILLCSFIKDEVRTGDSERPPHFCHSKRNTFVSRIKHVQISKHRHCRNFYEIVNETLMSLGMLETQINTGV